MKKVILLLSIAAMALCANAKNLKAEPSLDHDLWWEAPEQPSITLCVNDTTNAANTSVLTFSIAPDIDQATPIFTTSQSIDLAPSQNKEVKFDISLNNPGFYVCKVFDDGNLIRTFNIGYEPTCVLSLPDSKPDFEQFWADAKAELATIPGNFTMVEDKEMSGKKRKAYQVSMTSLDGDTIRGYLYVPIKKGKYPVHVYFNGYGGQIWPFDVDGRPDWIEFVTSVRGQMYNAPYNKYGDWIQYRLDDPAKYYYRGAFMDTQRFIDFVEQLPQADTDAIFAEGGSQGGALTLVAAALDPRIKAIAVYVPFLSDYRHYFDIVEWPGSAVKNAQKTYNLTDEQMYDNLTYFDVKNFVRDINCPVLMAIGLQDPTCPPHTNMASYTLINSPKQLIIYPTLGHTVDYSDWNPKREQFFIDNMKTNNK